MSLLARPLARALLAIGVVTLLAGVLICGLGLYLGTWPLRRLGRRDARAAKIAAVQELALAIAGAVNALRR